MQPTDRQELRVLLLRGAEITKGGTTDVEEFIDKYFNVSPIDFSSFQILERSRTGRIRQVVTPLLQYHQPPLSKRIIHILAPLRHLNSAYPR